MGEIGAGPSDLLNEAGLADAAEEKETHAFEIDPSQVDREIGFGALYQNKSRGGRSRNWERGNGEVGSEAARE
ncbi:hypothetical protein ACFX13_009919 [Malus domestica]